MKRWNRDSYSFVIGETPQFTVCIVNHIQEVSLLEDVQNEFSFSALR